MITSFHHIALIISSEDNLEFYRRLGFKESFRKKRLHDIVVLMDGYGMQLEIFIDSSHCSHQEPEPIGLRHFALKVDEIEKTILNLGLSKKDVGPIMIDWTGVRFCFVKDPDGVKVELHE